jgi:hypothetical protein
MPGVQKRKYEKITDAEIDLVLKCQDSHEFYERYREVFPDKKKGIDSISKIWKRRGEFQKKQQVIVDPEKTVTGPSPELENLIAVQNKLLMEISSVLKEHLRITQEIRDQLLREIPVADKHSTKPVPPAIPEHKDPARKPVHDKPADIMIGS